MADILEETAELLAVLDALVSRVSATLIVNSLTLLSLEPRPIVAHPTEQRQYRRLRPT